MEEAKAWASSAGETWAVISYSISDDQALAHVRLLPWYPSDWPAWYALTSEAGLPGSLVTDIELFEPSRPSPGREPDFDDWNRSLSWDRGTGPEPVATSSRTEGNERRLAGATYVCMT